jgi:hypothetical protein
MEVNNQEWIDQAEKLCSGSSPTKNEQFDRDGYLVIKNLWSVDKLYHPLPNVRGQLNYWDNDPEHFHHQDEEPQVNGALARYWHPQYRRSHDGIRLKLQKIIGRLLYNTYYYDRFYFGGQQLNKHTDRSACEISVSIHISTNLEGEYAKWPFKIKSVSGEERELILEPGDGLLYKGCERPHWRDPLKVPRRRKRDIILRKPETEWYYHQIFFHYVLQDGQRANCAWDMSR